MPSLAARTSFPKINGCLTGKVGLLRNPLAQQVIERGFHLFHGLTLHSLPTDPPYISKAKNTGVSVGQKGILSCEASAVPTAEFQWFKEDTRYLGTWKCRTFEQG